MTAVGIKRRLHAQQSLRVGRHAGARLEPDGGARGVTAAAAEEDHEWGVYAWNRERYMKMGLPDPVLVGQGTYSDTRSGRVLTLYGARCSLDEIQAALGEPRWFVTQVLRRWR